MVEAFQLTARRRRSASISRDLAFVGWAVALFLVLQWTPVLTTFQRQSVDDVGQSLAAALALVSCARAARRSTGRPHRGWVMLAAGAGLWFAGQVLWTVTNTWMHAHLGAVCPSDVGFLGAVPIEALGLVWISFPEERPITLLRTVLEAMLVVSSLLLAFYLLVIRDLISVSHAGRLAIWVNLAYPVGDIVLVAIGILALSRANPRLRCELTLIVAGLVGIALSDSLFSLAEVSASHRAGGMADAGWFAGLLLIAVAALRPQNVSARITDELEGFWQASTPYVLVMGAMSVRVSYLLAGDASDAFVRWLVVAIVFISAAALIVHREYLRRAEIQRRHRSRHDEMTGMPNIFQMETELNGLLERNTPVGVAYCNLSRLRAVNAGLGRGAGDSLLVEVARRLRDTLPSSCQVGRAPGDEFVAILPGASTRAQIDGVAEMITAALAEPFDLAGHHHGVGVNIGTALSRSCAPHGDELIRQAHQAMLRARLTGPTRIEHFDPTHDRPTTAATLDLEDALRSALNAGRGLTAHFQPTVELDGGRVVGHEALVRWEHPEHGLLGPASFLDVAEETGLVEPLGWWMLRHATQLLSVAAEPDGWIAVNVAGAQLGRGRLIPAVRSAMEAAALEPSRLHLEITESQLVNATPAVAGELIEAAEMGVVVALDDFGTGYSSLSLLRQLPVKVVKIDRSFVAPINQDRFSRTIVNGVIGMCRDLGIDIVAEGIEEEAQAEALIRMGCRYGQGYLFGRPARRFRGRGDGEPK